MGLGRYEMWKAWSLTGDENSYKLTFQYSTQYQNQNQTESMQSIQFNSNYFNFNDKLLLCLILPAGGINHGIGAMANCLDDWSLLVLLIGLWRWYCWWMKDVEWLVVLSTVPRDEIQGTGSNESIFSWIGSLSVCVCVCVCVCCGMDGLWIDWSAIGSVK